jgi:hypothetical protein
MASLAELMVQGQLQATDPQKGPNLSGSFAAGADLALKQQQVQVQQQQAAQHQQEIDAAKITKVMDAVEKAQQYSGKAQSQYITKILPGYVRALGLEDKFPLENLQFAMSTPENQARIGVLRSWAQQGKITGADGIAIAMDPIRLAEVPVPAMGDSSTASNVDIQGILDAEKTSLGNAAQMGRTVYTQEATSARAAAEDARAGQVTVDRDFAKQWSEYKAGGGSATVDKNLAQLEEARDMLKKNPNLVGKLSAAIPGVKSSDVQDVLNPATSRVRDKIFSAISGSLRQINGAQFTENEATRTLNQTFNPRLDAATNIANLDAQIRALKEQAAAKEAAGRHFEDSGMSLKGFKPPRAGRGIPDASRNDVPPPLDKATAGKRYDPQKANALAKEHPERIPEIAKGLGMTEAEFRVWAALPPKRGK